MKEQKAYYILWNSSKENFDNIIKDIHKRVQIKLQRKVKIKKYKELICDIYEFNNQNDLGVYKAEKMCDGSDYTIILLEVIFFTNAICDYSAIKELKNEIRRKYKTLTNNYFHDNIIHGTDSFEEYKYLKNLILNFDKYTR